VERRSMTTNDQRPTTNKTIVAIDGPSGVGKTTTSRLVARALNIPHIDTGAMYRALGLAAKRAGIGTRDAEALERLASHTRIDFIPGEAPRVLLDGEDVTSLIRTPEISMAASDVSAVPAVRRVLVRLQQELGRRSGGVLEGRDIGTKVFPETPHKFFLTARPEVRARRRYEELLAKGQPADYKSVLAECLARDEQDSSRQDSPLTYDETYRVIDTSDLSIPEVVDRIVTAVRP
jgi:cytidylate kinase